MLYGRDGVLEDKLLLRCRLQQHRVFVEAADAARKLGAVHQVDGDGLLLTAHGVKERILYVLGSRFCVHGRPRLKIDSYLDSDRLHLTLVKFKVYLTT